MHSCLLTRCGRAFAASLFLGFAALAQDVGQAKKKAAEPAQKPKAAAPAKKAEKPEPTAEEQAKKAKAAAEAQMKETIKSFAAASGVAEKCGDLPGAIEPTLRLRELEPENTKHLARLLALYQKAGMARKRVDVYHELLKLQPKNPSHTSGLATALYRLDQKDEAFKLWDGLLAGDKIPVGTYQTVGNAYKGQELYEQALHVYSEGLEHYSEDYSLLYHRGHALEMLGRNEEAIEAYEKARLHTKNPSSVDSKLARMYVVAGIRSKALQRKRDDAAAALEKLAKLNQELGDKLAQAGKHDDAKAAYEQALKWTSSEPLKKAAQQALDALAKAGK